MYVCMYVCMYMYVCIMLYIIHIYIHVNMYTHDTSTQKTNYVPACTKAAYKCSAGTTRQVTCSMKPSRLGVDFSTEFVHAGNICAYLCMYVCMYVFMYVRMYVHCVCVYMCIYIIRSRVR